MGFSYTTSKSVRAKWIRIEVNRNGEVRLIVPRNTPRQRAEDFLASKTAWVLKKLKFFKNYKGPYRKPGPRLRRGRISYLKNKETARDLVLARLEHFNKFYSFKWGRVSIKNHKSRWGSCSKRGNLNFNYRIVLLPAELADYLIVHELCHLKELNHSRAFWALVGKTCPLYRHLRYRLMHNGFSEASLI